MLPHFEMGPIRPPSEGGGNSLLVRLTRNCPWSRCRFCAGNFYNHSKFELRTMDEIKKDIDAIKQIADTIRNVSWQVGRGGKVDEVVGTAIVRSRPELQSDHCFVTVFYWLYSGGHTAFLQDADSLVMRTPDLIEAITYLKNTFPSLDRITSYARAKTIYRKTPEELDQLKKAGLQRLHIGLESGDDELLQIVDKGITSEQHIIAGKKVKEAGMELSLYIMPDLGGRKLSEQHARNTARVLSAINPDYIRSRPLIPRSDTPIFQDCENGTLILSSPHERLQELKILVENLDITSKLCFDHFGNSWYRAPGKPLFRRDYEGYKFPEEKQLVLDLIDEGLKIDESVHIHVNKLMHLDHL
jgi:radical SAM superfamily enzyme YgiQ (UPF0313 family)